MVVDCWVVPDDVDKGIKVLRRRGHVQGMFDFHFGRLCLCPHPLLAMGEKKDFIRHDPENALTGSDGGTRDEL